VVRVPQVGQLRHPVLLHLHQRHTRHQRRVVVHLRPGAREVNHPCRCRAPTPVKHPVSEWSSDASGMDRPRILYVRPRYSESPALWSLFLVCVSSLTRTADWRLTEDSRGEGGHPPGVFISLCAISPSTSR
jgi:hypothetical protein